MRVVLRVVLVSALAVCAFGGLQALPVQKPLAPVATTGGTVVGLELGSGVKAWLGVPFAEPPTGNLRWREPKAFRWQGVWNADRKMAECPQVMRAHDINHYYGEEPMSEDCLYLNVWAPPSSTPGSKLPVIVYLYGGGFTIGSAGIATYGGEAVAGRGAVFVNFNYRVGIIGFLAHPELTKEQGGHSGNYGLMDQTLALRWIKDNIEKFGGDPSRILVLGQSAGAGSVSQQLMSPMAKGLFQRAVMSSGCNWGAAPTSLADGEKNGLAIQQYLGAADLAALRYLPADKFVAAQLEGQIGVTVTRGVRAGPVVDGYFMPKSPREIIESGQMNAMPIIASFNHDESISPLMNAKSAEEYRALAEKLYGAAAPEFLKLYAPGKDANFRELGGRVAREGGLESNARNCADMNARYNKQKSWIALFSQPPSFAPGVHIADYDVATTGAYHTADIPFWFGTLDAFNMLRTTRVWKPADYHLSSTMMDTLIAFAATGDPSTKEVSWPAWTPQKQVKLEFGGAKTAQVVPIVTKNIDWLGAHPAQRLDAAPGTGGRVGGFPRD